MKKLAFIFLALTLLIATLWLLKPTQIEKSADLTDIEDYFPALMEEAAIPGLAVARVKAGEITLMQTYGMADVDKGKPVTTNTLFNIASISKPIMGIVLMQLVDQGKLSLDQDINQYLPFNVDNPHIVGEKITLRNLATHTSGIDDFYDETTYGINKDPDTSLQQHLESLLFADGKRYDHGSYYLKQMPGEKRTYSNLGAGLAGYLVEATTGQSLADFSQSNLFMSLHLTQTHWQLKGLDLGSIAVPYEVEQCTPYLPICADTNSVEMNEFISEYFNPPLENKHFRPYPHYGNPQYPDGGIRTSIKDLTHLLEAILKNEDDSGQALLSDTSYREMFRLQLPESISSNQRFFWRDNSMGLTGHMGSDLGVFTAMYFDVEKKDGFIILMNRGMDTKAVDAMKKIAHRLHALNS